MLMQVNKVKVLLKTDSESCQIFDQNTDKSQFDESLATSKMLQFSTKSDFSS